jgi:hypothetical protein
VFDCWLCFDVHWFNALFLCLICLQKSYSDEAIG